MGESALQASDVDSLVMSPPEAAVLAKRDPGGWFIAGRCGKFIVGKFTAKGAWQVISLRRQPVVFSAVKLARLYLREMGIEGARCLTGRAQEQD